MIKIGKPKGENKKKRKKIKKGAVKKEVTSGG